MHPRPEGTRDDDADDADDGDEGYGCCFLSWYITGETEIRQAHGRHSFAAVPSKSFWDTAATSDASGISGCSGSAGPLSKSLAAQPPTENKAAAVQAAEAVAQEEVDWGEELVGLTFFRMEFVSSLCAPAIVKAHICEAKNTSPLRSFGSKGTDALKILEGDQELKAKVRKEHNAHCP